MSRSLSQLYFYSPEGLAHVRRSGAQASTLVRAAGQVVAQSDEGHAAFYATDLQGSILSWWASDVSCAKRYTAYGRDGENGCDALLLFNGQRKEAVTGHYLLGDGYRAYNPVTMRFNSPDSLSPFGEGGMNAYGYCKGDPVNHIDPSGRAGYPPNNFLQGGVFTKRWGLRVLAAIVGDGQEAPALKNLPVKAALSETDPALKSRVRVARTKNSWNSNDVQRLENAAVYLRGRANRFKLAEVYFANEGFEHEAQAANATSKEISYHINWVDGNLSEAKTHVFSGSGPQIGQLNQNSSEHSAQGNKRVRSQ